VFVFEAAFVFSLNTMYLVFGHRYQKCIQMVGLTTCPRFHLGYRKAIFSCFCMLDHMLNFLDLQKNIQKLPKHPLLFLLSFISHSIHPKNDHCNVSFFSFICHWFLHNYRKRRTRTTLITTINNPKTKI